MSQIMGMPAEAALKTTGYHSPIAPEAYSDGYEAGYGSGYKAGWRSAADAMLDLLDIRIENAIPQEGEEYEHLVSLRDRFEALHRQQEQEADALV